MLKYCMKQLTQLEWKVWDVQKRGAANSTLAKYLGALPWSKDNKNIELWTLVARRFRGYKINARTILWKRKEAGFNGETDLSLHDANQRLTQSYINYRKIVQDGKENRIDFINDLAIINWWYSYLCIMYSCSLMKNIMITVLHWLTRKSWSRKSIENSYTAYHTWEVAYTSYYT